jgi:predicted DNA-binding transcriptional regulator AlpA
MELAHTRLNVLEAASLLRVSKSWLDKKRLDGGGPEYHKFGRRVVYDQRDLDSWAARNKRRHTSQPSSSDPVTVSDKLIFKSETSK